ncbi:MAG: cytochrome [Rubritepida sp.]|nr:cytochrome [Rubritepida sp.]
MWWRALLLSASFMLAAAVLVHYRKDREYATGEAAQAMPVQGIVMSGIIAGGGQTTPRRNPYSDDGYDLGEGRRLYRAYNCNGCHANGGGGIGPALMDERWIYGAEPENIFAAIMEGRPNGMPSFRNRIPEAQAWQIVAYVRSLSGLVSTTAAPGRADQIRGTTPPGMTTRQEPVPSGPPQQP